jgi:beta-1,2-mannosidase
MSPDDMQRMNCEARAMMTTKVALVSLGLLFAGASIVHSQTDMSVSWMIGPFTKQDSVNPVLGPRPESLFNCPVRGTPVRWESKDVFNPAAVVRNDTIFLLYRAQDSIGRPAGTSRIGLAWSTDGLRFTRYPVPVLYPDEDFMKGYEWEGGCEDPRIVEDERGLYIMTYTSYDGETARLCIASSIDLYHWKKEGPAFGRVEGGRYIDLWSKSGAIVTRRVGDRNIAMKISDRYWMYWGESDAYLATSMDLLHWKPTVRDDGNLLAVFAPRDGFFDSGLVEPGPPATLTNQGILLMYNSKNAKDTGDQSLLSGVYTAGQVLADSTNPSRILRRSDTPFIKPDRSYELQGQVNYVCFIEGLVHYKQQWFLYYGTADSRIAVAAAQY